MVRFDPGTRLRHGFSEEYHMLLQSLLAGLAVLIILAAAASSPSPALAKPVAGATSASARPSPCWPVIIRRSDGSRVRILRCI
jgi:hypothetical protein